MIYAIDMNFYFLAVTAFMIFYEYRISFDSLSFFDGHFGEQPLQLSIVCIRSPAEVV